MTQLYTPHSLFKFSNRIKPAENLLQGIFCFTEPDKLNDPSEMLRNFDVEIVAESLALLRRTGHTDEQFAWLNNQFHLLNKLSQETRIFDLPKNRREADALLKLHVYDNAHYMNTALQKTLTLMRRRTGLLSFCSNLECLPMWAHYASNASGYVFEYQGLGGKFTGDQTGTLNRLTPVSYHSIPPSLTFDPSSQNNVFFSKHEDWAYEREWRVARALEDCKKTDEIFLYDTEVRPVTLTLGWKMNREDSDQLLNSAVDVCSVYRAKIGRDGRIVREAV